MLHCTFWIWIISRSNKAWLYKGLTIWSQQGIIDWQMLNQHSTSNPVMIGVVSSIPTGATLFFCWNFFIFVNVSFVQKARFVLKTKALIVRNKEISLFARMEGQLFSHTNTRRFYTHHKLVENQTIHHWVDTPVKDSPVLQWQQDCCKRNWLFVDNNTQYWLYLR